MNRAASGWFRLRLRRAAGAGGQHAATIASAPIAGGRFESVLPPAPDVKTTVVRAVPPRRGAGQQCRFRAFVRKHPEWRRDRVAGLFADEGYLRHWASAADPGRAIARQPVTQVSWFAASAYCEARGARLPRWYEWEFAAAASATAARCARRSGMAPADPRLVFEVGARRAAGGRRVAGQLLRRSRSARRGVGMGRRRRLHAGQRRQPRAGRSESQPVLRHRRAQFRAEGQLRHDDAHRDVVEHEGVVQLELDGFAVRATPGASMTARASLAVRAAARTAAFAADASDRSASLYQMHEKLLNQDGKAIDLDVYRGQPVLVTMFYGSCPATCPLIIDTLRAVERKLDEPRRQQLRVLLISLDAGRDTPEALRKVADERRVDTTRWTLAHADAAAVRRIAAALNIQYRQLPNGEFSHSTIISALDADGKILAQSAELGRADPGLLQRDQRALSGCGSDCHVVGHFRGELLPVHQAHAIRPERVSILMPGTLGVLRTNVVARSADAPRPSPGARAHAFAGTARVRSRRGSSPRSTDRDSSSCATSVSVALSIPRTSARARSG